MNPPPLTFDSSYGRPPLQETERAAGSGARYGRSVSEGLDRRLAAVMFTDMVGYTALMQADERLAVDRRDRYVTALDRYHDALGGTVVQRLGDGSMSMFPSSLAAVLAAVAIQQELVAKDVPVRIGDPCRRGDHRAGAAHRRSGEHRGQDRVVRCARWGDVVRRRVRPDQESERRRGRPAGAVQAQERRAAVRALRGFRRRRRRAGPGGAGGQGRAVREPPEQPARPHDTAGRPCRRSGVAR